MPELFLNGSYVRTARQQVSCEGVAESVAAGFADNAGVTNRHAYRPLQSAGVHMVPMQRSRSGIGGAMIGREYVLPPDLSGCIGIFAIECVRQPDRTESGQDVALVYGGNIGDLQLEMINENI